MEEGLPATFFPQKHIKVMPPPDFRSKTRGGGGCSFLHFLLYLVFQSMTRASLP